MSTVRVIKLDNGRVALISPFNADVPPAAKKIGGRWDAAGKNWTFDGRDEERVRALALNIFGTDGSPEAEYDTVTVRWAMEYLGQTKGDNRLRLGGRLIAERRTRDGDVSLGQGVILVQGGFAARGGSQTQPALCPLDDTVLEIRDIPRSAVPAGDPDITIVDDQADVQALTAERARLLARLAEIDAVMAVHAPPTA